MKKMIMSLLCLGAFSFSCLGALACNECHSKKPSMVKMHRELGYKDCFVCHGVSKKRSPEDQRVMMASDQLCIRCHRR